MTPPPTLTESEIDRLLYWLKADLTHRRTPYQRARDYLIGSLMADAGLRVSEVTTLRPAQLLTPCNDNTPNTFNPEKPLNTIHIPAPDSKNNHARTIPLTERIKSAIVNYTRSAFHYLHPATVRWAFPGNNHDKPISTRHIQRIIDRAGNSALHRPVNPHLLRHTFATRIVRATNTSVAQQLLGHKALSSTQRYLHPNQDDLTQAIASLNKPKG